MKKDRKEYIDTLWQNTLYGKWVLAAANDDTEEAGKIASEVMTEYPFTLGNAATLTREMIIKELNYPGELDEYIEMLNQESYKLVDFIISNCSLFDSLQQQ